MADKPKTPLYTTNVVSDEQAREISARIARDLFKDQFFTLPCGCLAHIPPKGFPPTRCVWHDAKFLELGESGSFSAKKLEVPPLEGWKAICEAYGIERSQWRKLRKANQVYNGPIRLRGKARGPLVFKRDLLAWRKQVYSKWMSDEVPQRDNPAKHLQEAPYGKTGMVIPSESDYASMGVKRRRADRLKKKPRK